MPNTMEPIKCTFCRMVSGLLQNPYQYSGQVIAKICVNAIGVSGVGGTYQWNGKMDEIRLTKGVARYSGNYSVATAAFPNF